MDTSLSSSIGASPSLSSSRVRFTPCGGAGSAAWPLAGLGGMEVVAVAAEGGALKIDFWSSVDIPWSSFGPDGL